jgi:hypothetical protein
MAYNCDEETLQRMAHNIGDSITTKTTTSNKPKQEVSILFSDIIMKYALCQRRNILKKRVSKYKQENYLLYIHTYIHTYTHTHTYKYIVYYFTTIITQTKHWKQIEYLNPLQPTVLKIIFKNSIPTIQNGTATLS